MSSKTLLYLIITILALNVVVLYWFVLSLTARVDKQMARQSLIASSSAMLLSEDPDSGKIIERNVTFIGPTQSCDDCPDRIANLEDELAELKRTISNTPESPAAPAASSTNVKELFVTLGSGSIIEKDWKDVPGASAYIDTNNYGAIKSTAFEGAIRVPQSVGRAYVRLYNKTANHPVWFSEQSTESVSAFSFQSDKITLDSGNNLYQVQMKSTIGSEVVVDNARIKIVLQ